MTRPSRRSLLLAAAILATAVLVAAAIVAATLAFVQVREQVAANCRARVQLRNDVAFVLQLAKPTAGEMARMSPVERERVTRFYGQAIGRISRVHCQP